MCTDPKIAKLFFDDSHAGKAIECGEGFQISGCSRVTDNSEMEVPG